MLSDENSIFSIGLNRPSQTVVTIL